MKRVRKIRKVKKTKEQEQRVTKRIRKSQPITKIESVFYLCTKTLYDGFGNICFLEGEKYLLKQIAVSKFLENASLLLRSEVWGNHLIKKRSWGVHFEKCKEIEKLTQEQIDYFNKDVYEWQLIARKAFPNIDKTFLAEVVRAVKKGENPKTLKRWVERPKQTKPTTHKRTRLNNDKPKRVRKVAPTIETSENVPKKVNTKRIRTKKKRIRLKR